MNYIFIIWNPFLLLLLINLREQLSGEPFGELSGLKLHSGDLKVIQNHKNSTFMIQGTKYWLVAKIGLWGHCSTHAHPVFCIIVEEKFSKLASRLVNDRNDQNQFRPKPKFRLSWPNFRPKFRPKLYHKIGQNYVKMGSYFHKTIGLIWKLKLQPSIRYNFTFFWFIRNKINTSNYFWNENGQKLEENFQKLAKMTFFWPFRRFGGLTEISAELFRPILTEISAEISVSVVHYTWANFFCKSFLWGRG